MVRSKNEILHTIKYVLLDVMGVIIAWTLFWIFRKKVIESSKYQIDVPLEFNASYFKALIILPICWVLLYAIIGYYKDIYRKSRLKELGQTMLISLIGSLVIFFAVVLNDEIVNYTSYYESFLVLFGASFICIYLPRFILTTRTAHRIHKRKIGFNTLILGSNQKAIDLYKEMNEQPKSSGNLFVGFITFAQNKESLLENYLPNLGTVKMLNDTIRKFKVEELIVAVESSEHEILRRLLVKLENTQVIVKIIPDTYDILTGMVKMNAIFGAPLIEVSFDIMPVWQQFVKRIMDIVISVLVLIFGAPLYLILILGVKFSSKGPAFYRQERIGLYGKPFNIIKFRSMYTDAEKAGPALSSDKDSRVTPFGRFLRKYRFDELPQFYNVLKGEMSLVGPRPERQFFIDQIKVIAPHYRHLQKVRPGITSWGQVKYGYASNVDEMAERLKYDILYLENMSLAVDFKILIYTVLIVFQGRGK